MNNEPFSPVASETPDLSQASLEKLKTLFPHLVTESEKGLAVDWDLMRQEFSDSLVEGEKERYRLDWPGKREALHTANRPTTSTLRPDRESSKAFDTTQNLYIEGDNLEALKLLRQSYLGKVKMIYIDPPYNTGNDFIYNDNFARTKEEELKAAGRLDTEGRKTIDDGAFRQNPEANGRYHSDWLSMMYPRLKLARDLLSDDGVIFIHIDENEEVNLKKLCDELFGYTSFIGTIAWDKRNPKGEVWGIAQQHESIVAYCRDREAFIKADYLYVEKKNAKRMLKAAQKAIKDAGGVVTENAREAYKTWIKKHDGELTGGEAAYKFIDDDGNVYRPVSMAWPNIKRAPDDYFKPLIHPVTGKACPVPAKGWRNPPKTMQSLLERGLILFGEDESVQPRRKYLLTENMMEPLSSVLYYGGSDNACGLPFDNPKPVGFSATLIGAATENNELVLDFFSGSATTAHAVMQLNAEDGGKRKFILVQLPEVCDEKSEAAKAGYKTICEIGKERIRRAGEQIKAKCEADGKAVPDIGFRVLKVDSTNLTEVKKRPEETLQSELGLAEGTVKAERTEEDLLFQAIRETGALPLTCKIEKQTVAGVTLWVVEEGALVACLAARGITAEVAAEMAKMTPAVAVFREEGFANDTVKANVAQQFVQRDCATTLKVL